MNPCGLIPNSANWEINSLLSLLLSTYSSSRLITSLFVFLMIVYPSGHVELAHQVVFSVVALTLYKFGFRFLSFAQLCQFIITIRVMPAALTFWFIDNFSALLAVYSMGTVEYQYPVKSWTNVIDEWFCFTGRQRQYCRISSTDRHLVVQSPRPVHPVVLVYLSTFETAAGLSEFQYVQDA